MKLFFKDELSVEDYMSCIETTGWGGILEKGREQLQLALIQSWYRLTVYNEAGALIGCGRIISDGKLQALLCDIIVLPHYQAQGVGSKIVNHLVSRCKQHDITMVFLFSAKGKSQFYMKNGFKIRDEAAPGMYYIDEYV